MKAFYSLRARVEDVKTLDMLHATDGRGDASEELVRPFL